MNTYSAHKPQTGLVILFNPNGEELDFLIAILSQEGFYVKTVFEEHELLNVVGEEPVNIVLMAGYFASQKYLEQVKQHRQNIKTLLLLPEKELFLSEKVFNLGFSDYIPCPYKKEELLARVGHQITIYKLQKENQKLRAAWEKASIKAETCSTIDNLTGLANRRQLEDYLDKEWLRCARERVSFGDADQTAISLIIGDLDYFNIYNDQYGYQLGDNCLQLVAEAIKEAVKRPADLVARYGGSKIAILLPNTDGLGALQLANIVKEKIEDLKIIHAFSTIGEYLTLSMGIASAIPSQAMSAEVLIGAAERALFEAKEQGGNRIISDNS
jgi:diguanylate cyclase (GGDEF)-like protein